MVKILLIYNGDKAASCLQTHLSDSLQIELTQVRSISEGEERYNGNGAEVILIPFPVESGSDIQIIVRWQRRCRSDGFHPGFLLYTLEDGLLTFFDISHGSISLPAMQSDSAHQLISSLRQVSGRSKVERSLREDYDHHNRIISMMPLSVLDVNGGIISRANPCFIHLSGYDESDIPGASPDRFFSSESYPEYGQFAQHL